MFIDKNSITVNGVSLGQYITAAQYQYNKLWSSDTGRNLAGTNTGTLIGIFPKIVVSFRKLTKAEMEYLVPILDSAIQSLTYYDPNKKAYTTMETYTGDYQFDNEGIIGKHKNGSFDVSFIAVRRR